MVSNSIEWSKYGNLKKIKGGDNCENVLKNH